MRAGPCALPRIRSHWGVRRGGRPSRLSIRARKPELETVKKILVLGAGQSAPYLISRLLDLAPEHDWHVTVGDLDRDLAARRVAGNERGRAITFDINDGETRDAWIGDADVVINMLAPRFLDLVAWDCLAHSTPMLSVSYRTRAIRDMHDEAVRKNTLLLCELGLDPGIDHMSAMALLQPLLDQGSRVRAFRSYGSGIPAPENADTNPMKYVVTWNPRNVAMSSETGAQYMERRKIKCVPFHHVFRHTWHVDVEGVGRVEAYPNRDSLSYMQSFGLEDVDTMIRGTLRWPGWSETWACIVDLGLPNEHLRIPDLGARTYRDVTEMFLPMNLAGDEVPEIEERVARFLGISPTGRIMENLRWLGLFSDETVRGSGDTAAAMLTHLLAEKMPLREGDRDVVILKHEIDVEHAGGETEHITSTMVHRGDPKGFTAMAQSVGAPVVIATKLLLTGQLDLVGAHIPLHPSIYVPALRELADEGFAFSESRGPMEAANARGTV